MSLNIAVRLPLIRGVAARMFFAVCMSTGLSLLSPATLGAAISQGYTAAESLAPGTLVSINPSKSEVTAADIQNSDGLLGVVVDGGSSALSLNNGDDKVQVSTSGTAKLFVSDINGPIKTGDQVAPSPIKGVGMKAVDSGKVVGVAQSDFDGKGDVKKAEVKTKDGKTKTVNVGADKVSVQVVYYTAPASSFVPTDVQHYVDTLAGKPVSLVKLSVVGLLLLIAILVVAVLLFASIRGSIISVGRNPLAKVSIYRGMLQVALTSVMILGAAIIGGYVVLSL